MGDANYVRSSGRGGRWAYRPVEKGNLRAMHGGAKYEVMPNGQWRRIGKVKKGAKKEGGGK